jgi:hypothetical protein
VPTPQEKGTVYGWYPAQRYVRKLHYDTVVVLRQKENRIQPVSAEPATAFWHALGGVPKVELTTLPKRAQMRIESGYTMKKSLILFIMVIVLCVTLSSCVYYRPYDDYYYLPYGDYHLDYPYSFFYSSNMTAPYRFYYPYNYYPPYTYTFEAAPEP